MNQTLELICRNPDMLRAEMERRQRKAAALASTEGFGRAMGMNVYDPASGRVPWMIPGVHGRVVELLDRAVEEIDNPIKIIAIPRGHFKTSICGCALSRIHFKRPWGRSGIFSARERLSCKGLRQIRQIWQSPPCQELFGELLFPPQDREAYQRNQLNLNHERVGGEPSITAFGMESSSTGFHFDTVLWIDDLIDWRMAKSVDEMEKAYESLKDLLGSVADPGCEIWLTFTRYNLNDPYGKILAEDSEYWPDIVPDPIIEGCYEETDQGRKPIFPLRFCDARSDVMEPVELEGKPIRVPRKSLQAIREKFGEAFFASQYLNSPLPEGDTTFRPEWFGSRLNVAGPDFFDWIERKENYSGIAPFPQESRGPWDVAVLGDPAYGDRRHNDCAVLWVIAADRFNHWFFLDYVRAKYGVHRIDEYCRRALEFYRDYTGRCGDICGRNLAVESHGSGVMIGPTIRRLELEMGITARKAALKDNSHIRKEQRIMSLEPVASSLRMHFCKNVEAGRQQLSLESQTFRSGGSDDVIDTAANGTQVFKVRSETVVRPAPMADFSHLSPNIRRFLRRRAS